jgi:aspartate kinase
VSIVVQKYGGSSVADVEKIQRVADRVAATHGQGLGVVVVVSAMGDTTDELLELARRVSESPSRRELDMLLSVGERITMTLLSMAEGGSRFRAGPCRASWGGRRPPRRPRSSGR